MKHKVPVQSLIDHIKTAVDVDPWAKEMAEELLKEQDYRSWLMDMFHKYGRNDLIALLVRQGEEKLLADMLKEQEKIEQVK